MMKQKQHFPSSIIFFGPDAVGKSTQVRLLTRYLESHKCRTFRVWIRGNHSLAFLLAKFFVSLGYYRTVTVPSGVTYKLFNPSLLPKLRHALGFIEFLSILPLIILKFWLPKILGYTIIAERYVVDTVVYLSYVLGYDILQSKLAKVLLCFIPKDSVLIHFDAETEVLLKRLKRIRYDVATQDYIMFQQRSYDTLSKALNAKTIDTSVYDKNETFDRIVELLTDE